MTTLNSLLRTPWSFIHPTKELYTNTVDSAKYFLDPLAASVSDSQSARLQNNKKRKRSDIERDDTAQILHMKQLYAEGFTPDQIWEQATRILGSAGFEIGRDFALSPPRGELPLKDKSRSAHFDDAGSEGGQSKHRDSVSSIGDSPDESIDGYSDGTGAESDPQPENSNRLKYDTENDTDGGLDGDADSEVPEEDEQDAYVEDPFGLNDGFFSIDDFNKQTEAFERQDTKGVLEDDDDSEEEAVDWHADPLASGNITSMIKGTSEKPRGAVENSESESSDDEEGPTFGDVDLREDSDSEDEDLHIDGGGDTSWINTNDIKYSDFFAPPRKPASAKKTRPLPKTQPDREAIENDMGHAMADVRRDLFDDDDASVEDGADSDNDLDIGEQRSTHEKRRARVADEIRRLEAANVAKKEWMLAGEARAAERPVNSLIEEDLEFERTGKPVPVATNELTEDIEELVKRRILSKEFDEVIRRHPGAISDIGTTRKGKFELDDTKAQQSLAEQYENDHLRATDPNYVDVKDQKLKREHADIASLWKEIGSQLDTLSNWHYKPKAPQASINVVTDVPTVLMEEARPTATSAVVGPEALAPQEIYTPASDGKAAGELVRKSGLPVSKGEMTREEKAKLRRQHKEEKRKSNARETKSQPGKAAEKQQLTSDLKKGGVKVIGKQGEVTDVYGDKAGVGSAKNSAETLKL